VFCPCLALARLAAILFNFALAANLKHATRPLQLLACPTSVASSGKLGQALEGNLATQSFILFQAVGGTNGHGALLVV
jgi:hypothetical protein